MARILKSNRGFSLIEVIVALGILGFVLLPFLSFISFRLARERQNDELIRALEIIKSKMEETLVLPQIKDHEETIENRFLLKIKVLDGDDPEEPINLSPVEVNITIFRLQDSTRIYELRALR